jgi:hypothetical protein
VRIGIDHGASPSPNGYGGCFRFDGAGVATFAAMGKNLRELLREFDMRQRCTAEKFPVRKLFDGNFLEKRFEDCGNY